MTSQIILTKSPTLRDHLSLLRVGLGYVAIGLVIVIGSGLSLAGWIALAFFALVIDGPLWLLHFTYWYNDRGMSLTLLEDVLTYSSHKIRLDMRLSDCVIKKVSSRSSTGLFYLPWEGGDYYFYRIHSPEGMFCVSCLSATSWHLDRISSEYENKYPIIPFRLVARFKPSVSTEFP